MNLDIVVLAAGKGKRMFSDLPKVLHPIGGKPMLQHVLQAARALGPRRLVVVVGHGADQVRQRCAADDLHFVEQSEQLGTGHALKCALPALGADGHTLVLYGDVPLLQVDTLRRLLTLPEERIGLLTDVMDDPSGYGRIVRDAAGGVCAIVEHKDADAEQRVIREVNTGILRLPNTELAGWLDRLSNGNAQGEYYLTDVIGMAARQGRTVETVRAGASWEVLGVNSRAQQAELERHWQRRQAEALLAAGVTLLDPARIDIRGSLTAGRDVVIDVNCVFEGEVRLGDGVYIGPNCVIRDAAIESGVQMQAFTHVDDATVRQAARVGPFSRLRPGADVGRDAHIGNFVEIKKASIGTGSKVNHLSYVGDASVGQGVNIGAGTITCNYDGVNKWKTVIEDNASVGAGTMLVAPLTVGQGATIGAGSVITKGAPAGELTVARARQTTINGWVRPVKKV